MIRDPLAQALTDEVLAKASDAYVTALRSIPCDSAIVDDDAAINAVGFAAMRAVILEAALAVSGTSEAGAATVSDDGLGLHVDMLDADRLRTWAEKIETHGADLSHWTTPTFAADWLCAFSRRLEATIRDVGVLRQRSGEPAPSPAPPTWRDLTPDEWVEWLRDVIDKHKKLADEYGADNAFGQGLRQTALNLESLLKKFVTEPAPPRGTCVTCRFHIEGPRCRRGVGRPSNVAWAQSRADRFRFDCSFYEPTSPAPRPAQTAEK